jgi:hypothetical protein
LLDYVNLSEQEEDDIPNNTSYPNFCLYKIPDRCNGLGYWPILKKELHSSGMAGGCSLVSNNVKSLPVGNKYHVTCHHYRTYKEKVNLKRKYVEGSDYMDGIATATVKQNRLIKMRGELVPSNPVKHRLSSILSMIQMPLWCQCHLQVQ